MSTGSSAESLGVISVFGLRYSYVKPGTEMSDTMRKLVEDIARSLVDDPGRVSVMEIRGQECTVLELRTALDNIGQVVGKQGRLAEAMRTILQAVGMKEGRRYILEILEH